MVLTSSRHTIGYTGDMYDSFAPAKLCARH
jgi:hypothetical protein